MARPQRKRGHDLKRRTGNRPERRTFAIVCEGIETEPGYFDALKQLPEIREVASVEIKARSGPQPLPLVEAAIEVKQENDEIDEVWCVFDIEAPKPHSNLNQALAKARSNGIKTAISNPCFEIWLILHFDSHTAWLSTDAAEDLRRKYDGSTGKEVAGDRYMPLRKTAAKNARDLKEIHIRNDNSFPDDNPSSGVFELLEAIEQRTKK